MTNAFLSPNYYRKVVEELCLAYDKNKEEFSDFLDAIYQEQKEALENHKLDSLHRTAIRNGLYIASVGLLTYGRIAVVGDILNNIPSSGRVQFLANIVKVILPLPNELQSLEKSEKIIEWVEHHKHRLIWDSENQTFSLSEDTE